MMVSDHTEEENPPAVQGAAYAFRDTKSNSGQKCRLFYLADKEVGKAKKERKRGNRLLQKYNLHEELFRISPQNLK